MKNLVLILISLLFIYSCNDIAPYSKNISGTWEVYKVTIDDNDVTQDFKQDYFRLINFHKVDYGYPIYNIIPKGYGFFYINYRIIEFSRAITSGAPSWDKDYNCDTVFSWVCRDSLDYPIYNNFVWSCDFISRRKLIISKNIKNKYYKIEFNSKDTLFSFSY